MVAEVADSDQRQMGLMSESLGPDEGMLYPDSSELFFDENTTIPLSIATSMKPVKSFELKI